MKVFILIALAAGTVNAASLNTSAHLNFSEGRIVNGQDAEKGEAKFIVSLRMVTGHFCGGSIINRHWVLTAAHCFIIYIFEVVAGLHQLNDKTNVQIRKVSSKDLLFAHEKYTGKAGPYDIGLIRIAEPFDLNNAVTSINLPSGLYENIEIGILYGWGLNNRGEVPLTLQSLIVKIIDHKKCKEIFASYVPLNDGNICSYNAGTTDSICTGDSGGPLVIETPDSIELVGIASWGSKNCLNSKYPSVHTKTLPLTDWIQAIIANFSVANMVY